MQHICWDTKTRLGYTNYRSGDIYITASRLSLRIISESGHSDRGQTEESHRRSCGLKTLEWPMNAWLKLSTLWMKNVTIAVLWISTTRKNKDLRYRLVLLKQKGSLWEELWWLPVQRCVGISLFNSLTCFALFILLTSKSVLLQFP